MALVAGVFIAAVIIGIKEYRANKRRERLNAAIAAANSGYSIPPYDFTSMADLQELTWHTDGMLEVAIGSYIKQRDILNRQYADLNLWYDKRVAYLHRYRMQLRCAMAILENCGFDEAPE
jgi:hypothetical protein